MGRAWQAPLGRLHWGLVVIVDTYNVLGVEGVLDGERAGLDLRGLVALISGSRLAGKRVLLVCDGAPGPKMPTGRIGNIEIVFSGGGRDADSLIALRLREFGGGRGVLVVSSDRAVRTSARRRGAKEISSEEFLAGLRGVARTTKESRASSALRRSVPLPDSAVRAWIDEFGLRASDLMSIAGAAAGASDDVHEAPPARRATRPDQSAREQALPAASGFVHEAAGPTQMWPTSGGAIDPSELEMSRWLDGVTRLRPRDA